MTMQPTPIFKSRARLGSQRDWIWRGWQIRYTFLRSAAQQGSPMLLLHGFGAALTQWQENLGPLSQQHSVYALDLLGFGASEKAAAAYKIDFWVEQVYDFWRSFINRPIVLVGHSLGALVALTAAVRHPEMVERLVLMTLPAARQELLAQWVQPIVGRMEALLTHPLLITPLFMLIRRPGVVRSILRKVYVNAERITEELVESFAEPGRDLDAAKAFFHLAQSRTRADFSPLTKELLPRVEVPILLLWGEHDRVIPLTWGRQLPPLNPSLKLVEIADAGHCPYDEAADRVNSEILAWTAA